MNKELAEAAFAGYHKRFNRRPSWAASAPGRVNLIGEHTDYNDGYVLPMAINRHVLVLADEAWNEYSTVRAMDLHTEFTTDLSRPQRPRPVGDFGNYLLGVSSQFAREGRVPNLDLAVTGNVPIGAGLASSAAVEVATATLLLVVTNLQLDPRSLALACQRAEHEYAQTPCGIMDMLVATHARANTALLIDCRSMEPRPIPLPPASEVSILVADTTVRRELSDSAYADRRRACAQAAERLGVRSLRELGEAPSARKDLDDEQWRCARHVVDENQRTLLAAAALTTGDLDALGELMFDSHASLRHLFRVSCPELDAVVEAAADLRGDGGVIGARMTGAGFGGCAVIACRTDAVEHVSRRIERRFEEHFGHRPVVFPVTAVGAAAAMDLSLLR
jgi:galactokinase